MISIVIPNFNSGDLLAKNIPKLINLLAKSKLDYEIIVSDDCSSDDSLRILNNLSNIKVLSSKTNTGFAGNVDRGIRAAKSEIVFILNAIDLLPASADYFSLMFKHFDDPQIFSVAALKRDTADHGCGAIYFSKGFFLHRHADGLTTAWADGGAQALRKEYYLKIGGFDPVYKFYWEDVDLGYRAWKAGYRIDFEPKAVLIHQKAAGPIARIYSERSRRVMNLRNQFIFTWKNGDLSHLLKHFLWEPYHFAVALKNHDWDFFKAFYQACLSLLS